MKIQHLLLAMALPVILTLTGCEATQPTIQTNTEPVAVVAPAEKSEAVAPAAEVNPEHCAKHSGHDCIAHCAKHKGKKSKACQKHCAHHGSATANTCDTSHCSHHKGAAAHKCGTEHCEKHGGDMSKCCGFEHKCDK